MSPKNSNIQTDKTKHDDDHYDDHYDHHNHGTGNIILQHDDDKRRVSLVKTLFFSFLKKHQTF